MLGLEWYKPPENNEINESSKQKTIVVENSESKNPEKIQETSKQKIDSLLAEIKEGREASANVGEKTEKLPQKEDIEKQLAGISGDEFLRYSYEDLKLLFTEDLGNGELLVNFYGNNSVYRAIGAGNLLDNSVGYVKIDWVIGKRTITERGKTGYVSSNGDYLEIDTDSKVQPLSTLSEEDQKLFESIQTYTKEQEAEANEKFTENFKKKEETIKNLEKYADADFDTYIKEGLGFSDFEMDKTPAWEGELKNIFQEMNGVNRNLTFDQAYAFFNAIAEQESGGRYTVLGAPVYSSTHQGGRAIGKYQIMPINWLNWSDGLPPTAKNQDIVAFKQNIKNLSKWMNQGNSYEEAVQLASVNWYGNNGKALRSIADISDRGDATLGYSPKKYSQSLLDKTRRMLT